MIGSWTLSWSWAGLERPIVTDIGLNLAAKPRLSAARADRAGQAPASSHISPATRPKRYERARQSSLRQDERYRKRDRRRRHARQAAADQRGRSARGRVAARCAL